MDIVFVSPTKVGSFVFRTLTPPLRVGLFSYGVFDACFNRNSKTHINSLFPSTRYKPLYI